MKKPKTPLGAKKAHELPHDVEIPLTFGSRGYWHYADLEQGPVPSSIDQVVEAFEAGKVEAPVAKMALLELAAACAQEGAALPHKLIAALAHFLKLSPTSFAHLDRHYGGDYTYTSKIRARDYVHWLDLECVVVTGARISAKGAHKKAVKHLPPKDVPDEKTVREWLKEPEHVDDMHRRLAARKATGSTRSKAP